MAVRTREELLNHVKNLLGERSDDEALAIIEDFTDSIDAEDWRAKYNENDAAWRARYRERFFDDNTVGGDGSSTTVIEPVDRVEVEEDEPITIDDLLFNKED